MTTGLAVAGAAALGLSWSACRKRDANVLLVTIDTLRADHLSCYGYGRRTTPVIDALASEGYRFERAWCQAPWTLPSMASLLSSRYPGELGIRDMKSKLPEDAPILPEAMAAGGYETGAVVAASLCGAKRGFDRGFEVFDDSNAKGHFALTSPTVTDLALAFLGRPRTRPFFLWVHYFDPHHAYQDHQEFRFFADQDYRGPVNSGQDINELFALNAAGRLGPADFQRLRDLYDSEIAFTDREVGRLLDGLRRTGRYDDTLILLTSDHGEEFGDHSGLSHTYSLFQELMHVPLLMKKPHSRRGEVVFEPVALLDVAPTILREAGLPPLPDAGGRHLLWDGPPSGDRTIMVETTQEKNDLRGVIAFPRKLLLDLRTGAVSQYDLSLDPGEQRPLVTSEDPEFARLGRGLGRWLRERRTVASARVELGEGEREMLRSLGYL